MGAVGVLLIYVLTVCLAKGSCLAGSDTNDGQESGLHRTLRDVFPNENSIKKALRLFHSMKTVVQVQLSLVDVENPAGSPTEGTATTSVANSPLGDLSVTVSSYDSITALAADAPDDSTTALAPEEPARSYDATTVFSGLAADKLAGSYDAMTSLPPEAPIDNYNTAEALAAETTNMPGSSYDPTTAVNL
ncbi:hypothetical protein Q5P01_023885 [Channa striata]|uniref:Uncharacterized protein n=1 Tax=Channa striata TaxID=64152 RepID=A0AA88LR41_CHASR|nr:hypothetical protein Q5P01_023885 [Channa striata]